MSEKLKIGSTEFDLVPMEIFEDTQGKTRSFTVIKNMEFDPMKTAILAGLTQVDHIGNDGNIANSYMDCVALKCLAVGYEQEQDTYTIILSTDASLGEIRSLQSKITALESNNTQLQETVDALVLATLEPKGSEPNV